MRLVGDILFCDEVDFSVAAAASMVATGSARSMEEAAIRCCELVGIELMDYGTFVTTVDFATNETRVQLRSRAWRARAERVSVPDDRAR